MNCEKLLEINLREICIPTQECLTIKPGSISEKILDEMDQKNYDYIPVIDNKCIYGLAKKSYLKEIYTKKGVLSAKDTKICNESIFLEIKYPFILLPSLLEKMSQEEAILSVQTGEVEGYYISNFLGLITLSDLNRHEIRFVLYRLIISLEARLAQFVNSYFSDDNIWIKKLNETEQIRILGYREFSKINNIEINAIEATNLSNLINIIAKTEEAIQVLQYTSRKDFEKCTGKIPKLRNSIMHVVRPLITKQNEISSLLETINFIDDLIQKLNKCNNSIYQSSNVDET